MNRQKFMTQLEMLLSDISESDRRDALEYYNNYFDDAGLENEAAVIQELGSPEILSAIIKSDLNMNAQEDFGEYTEQGYRDDRKSAYQQMPENVRRESKSKRGYPAQKRDNNKIMKIILIVLALFVFLPAILGVGAGVLGVVIGILALPVVGIFSLAAIVLALLIGGIAVAVVGIVKCFSFPALGVLEIGIGFLAVAVGIILLMLLAVISIRFIPWMIRKIVRLVQKF